MEGTFKDEKPIFEVYGKDAFLKVKECFAIDQLVFSFVKTAEGTKSFVDSNDIYMSITEARLFGEQLARGEFYKALEESRQKAAASNSYPTEVWKGRLGGKKSEDGVISRHMTLFPGSRKFAVMQATKQPGTVSDRGLIIPDNTNRDKIIRINVPFESIDDLRMMGLAIKDACLAYSVRTYGKAKPQSVERAS